MSEYHSISSIIGSILRSFEVGTIFGVPGTQNISLLDMLTRQGIRFISAADELGATFMANGAYRASGKLQIITAIPGPGFLTSLAGIGEAKADSAAVLLLVVRPERTKGRKFQLQDIDQRSIITPLVKGEFVIRTGKELSSELSRACSLSLEGEPGPVYVEILSSVLDEETKISDARPLEPVRAAVPASAISELADRLSSSSRIVIYAGQGASGASSELRALAELLNAPVFTTCSGRGVIPEDHPLSFYYDFSFGGGKELNSFLERADIVLALGCKFTHNGTGGFALSIPQEKLIRIDASEDVLSANYPASLGITGGIGDALSLLLAQIEGHRSDWVESDFPSVRERMKREELSLRRNMPKVLNEDMAQFLAALQEKLPRDSIIVTDSGMHQAAARTYLRVFRPNGMICPTDFQSMGFGIPGGIGAALASPRPVVVITGDGGFLMSGMELVTAAREGVNLLVLVFCDHALGLIRNQQIERYGRAIGTEVSTPDLETFSDACGIPFARLSLPFGSVLESIVAAEGVRIVEVPLTDSPEIEKSRRRAGFRSKMRKIGGEPLVRFMKRFFGR